jgi:hypothetical protein
MESSGESWLNKASQRATRNLTVRLATSKPLKPIIEQTGYASDCQLDTRSHCLLIYSICNRSWENYILVYPDDVYESKS